jgi:hypothetical protein
MNFKYKAVKGRMRCSCIKFICRCSPIHRANYRNRSSRTAIWMLIQSIIPQQTQKPLFNLIQKIFSGLISMLYIDLSLCSTPHVSMASRTATILSWPSCTTSQLLSVKKPPLSFPNFRNLSTKRLYPSRIGYCIF